MKKLLFLSMALVSLFLASCNKNEVSPTSSSTTLSNATAAVTDSLKKGLLPKIDSVAISSLPSVITTYITTNYAGATIKHAGKDRAGDYLVEISVSGAIKVLAFDSTGAFKAVLSVPMKGGPPHGDGKADSVAISSLPATITSYITTNYAGATIKHAGKDPAGNYLVEISVSSAIKLLAFDSTGAFKAVLTAPTKGGNKPDSVAISSLPTAITSYITTNYAGAAIKHAIKDPAGNYLVEISVSGAIKILAFDSTGTFKEILTVPTKGGPQGGIKPDSVAISSLPTTITTYITTNYAGATIKRAGKDAAGDYLVVIEVSSAIKELLFDSTGTFKKELAVPSKRKH